jgi:hypothetical protein
MNQVWKIALGVAFGIILAPILICSGCGIIAGIGSAGGAKVQRQMKAQSEARTKAAQASIAEANREGFTALKESHIFEGLKIYHQTRYDKEPEAWGTCKTGINWIGSEKVVMIEDITGKVDTRKLSALLISPDALYVKSP